ncbi:winged helix-turn-helix transcriptional regulator [Haloarcula amylovorans]|uniref:winged helix-turn-helix transcriptional regulator n=1 Tax=Haloarcula amylovorans TaxID=2562280 RepID=UPI001076959B|nr:helix-turn-helix domain-containing protein [Halomicroarcula amylolytica]
MAHQKHLTTALIVVFLSGTLLQGGLAGVATPSLTDGQSHPGWQDADAIERSLERSLHAASIAQPGADDRVRMPELGDVMAVTETVDEITTPGLVFLAGYSRYDNSDPLENTARNQIYDVISWSPGTYPMEIVDTTSLSRSTVRYHLRILEEEGLIASETVLGKQRYFQPGDQHIELLVALKTEMSRAVLTAIYRLEPVSVSQLAHELDRASSTVSYHLSRLVELGLVEQERDGSTVLTQLTVETELEMQRHVKTSGPAEIAASLSKTGR